MVQRTPGTAWVAFILGLVALVQQLWPESQYQVTVVVVLVGNFLAGMLETYWPEIQGMGKKGPPAGALGEISRPRPTFGQALSRAVWG